MGAVKATLGRSIKGARPVILPLGGAVAPSALRWAVVVGAAGIAGTTLRSAALIAPGRWAVAIGALWRAVSGVALLGAVVAARGAVGAVPVGPAVASVLRAVGAPVIAAAVSVAIGRARGFPVADRNIGKRRVGGLLGLGGVGVALFAHGAAGGSLDVAVRSHGEPVFS